MKVFKGKPIISGNVKGEALVSTKGFNTLASFQKSIIMRAKKAICSDQDNKELFKKIMTQKILCIPQTIGSRTGGLVILTIAKMNIEPKAFLFADRIDSLAAAGIILTDVWLNKKIITVDSLGKEFLEVVREGDVVEIKNDGTVILC
ncbi:MAG TPA: DUF126 domain-containing protein [Clostridia bacterium]|nr:DUF126 domain-containing protein [Clostridia bacterium]